MNLARALRFRMGGSAAVAGAGGKTTAVFQLARELPAPVVVSATVHLHIDQVRLADTHLVAPTPDQIAQADKNLHGVILVTGPVTGDRAMGLNPETIHQLKVFCKSHSLPLLIEADGSR